MLGHQKVFELSLWDSETFKDKNTCTISIFLIKYNDGFKPRRTDSFQDFCWNSFFTKSFLNTKINNLNVWHELCDEKTCYLTCNQRKLRSACASEQSHEFSIDHRLSTEETAMDSITAKRCMGKSLPTLVGPCWK